MLNTAKRTGFDDTHEMFRDSVRKFLEQEFTPNADRWEEVGNCDRDFWRKSGQTGLLCVGIPEEYGGPGLDFRYNSIVNEEMAYAGSSLAFSVQSDICAHYLLNYGTAEQKQRYLPGMVTGDIVAAIGMTEPSVGSDLKNLRTAAKRDGDHYVINGSKTYISNGQHADLLILSARTGEAGGRGVSLILVDTNTPGFARGRNLDKIGQSAADTSELFFDDMRVPVSQLLGEEGRGFAYMMTELPQERLAICSQAQAVAQRAFDEAVAFTKDRKAFGQTIFDLQNTRFTLAALATKIQVGWAHLDWALARHVAGELTTAEASAAKLFHTELQWEVVDAALQLHGGAGYMNEYPIARLWRDSRVSRIYGGTSEIMKEVVSRSI